MEKNKFYIVEKEFNGKKYAAQFSGVSAAVRAIDSSYIEGTSTTSTEKLGQYILDNIIVEPKGLTADDFETMEAGARLGRIEKQENRIRAGKEGKSTLKPTNLKRKRRSIRKTW